MADNRSLVEHCRKRWVALKAERDSWESVWKDISRFIAPDSGRFDSENRKGERKDQAILDNTAQRAWRTLAAGLHAGLSSPSQPWLELQAANMKMRDSAPVKAWLSEVRDLMLEVFSKSNTYRALHGMYEELGAFGTAAAVIMDDFDDVIHLHVLTVGSYCLATDAKGNVDTLYRRFKMTVGQMVDEFGAEQVSTHVLDQYRNGDLDQTYWIMHAIEPRAQTPEVMMRPGALGAPIMEVYYEEGRQDDRVLRESGYKSLNIIAPRWIVNGENVYGTSPGRDALGDVKQLQHAQLRKAQAIDYQTKPPVQGPANLKGNNSALLPGGYSPVDVTGAGNSIKQIFEVNLNLQHLVEDIVDTRQRISRTFFEDVFRMVSDMDRSGITARQIAEQHSEKMMLMGPVLERVQNECLSPLVEITFERMLQAGMLPEPPPQIQDVGEIQVKFISILAQAQKQASAGAVDRWLATVGTLAPLVPEVLDVVDADRVSAEYVDMLGINPALQRDEETVAQIRQARMQQQQQQQQMEQQAQQAGAAADMARAQAAGGGQQMPDNTARQLEIARFLGG